MGSSIIMFPVAFTSFGFISLYIAGKLHTFSVSGKSQSWKLCMFLSPILIALVIALSRTCDYHHHWQGCLSIHLHVFFIFSSMINFSDVLVGSILGSSVTYVCYKHYYPPLSCPVSHKSYAVLTLQSSMEGKKSNKIEDVKWI